MTLQPTRRGLITGLIAFVAAPAIVRAASLMPVKVMERAEPILYTEYRGNPGPTLYRTDRIIWLLGDNFYVEAADGSLEVWSANRGE